MFGCSKQAQTQTRLSARLEQVHISRYISIDMHVHRSEENGYIYVCMYTHTLY